MIHNIFCTYYISLDNNFHRIVFFRDVTNIIDYEKSLRPLIRGFGLLGRVCQRWV